MSDTQSDRRAAHAGPLRVLIVGGGVAGVEAALALTAMAGDRVELTLVSDRTRFVLRPQLLGEPWGAPAVRAELADLAKQLGMGLRQSTVVSVDTDARLARLGDGSHLPYDELLVTVGARASLAYPNALTIGFGPLPRSLAVAGGGELAIVVPPGTGWTLPAHQLALLAASHGWRTVRVVTPETAPLERFGAAPAARVAELLETAGVELLTRTVVPRGSDLSGFGDVIVALPEQHGAHLPGLPADRRGELDVDGLMRVVGVPGVHAAGDATAGPVKQGGLASQQAEVAARDMVRLVAAGGAPVALNAPVLRGVLEVPDGPRVYLERRLAGTDPGRWSYVPLWLSAAPLCAPRTVRWLNGRHDAAGAEPSDVVAGSHRTSSTRSVESGPLLIAPGLPGGGTTPHDERRL